MKWTQSITVQTFTIIYEISSITQYTVDANCANNQCCVKTDINNKQRSQSILKIAGPIFPKIWLNSASGCVWLRNLMTPGALLAVHDRSDKAGRLMALDPGTVNNTDAPGSTSSMHPSFKTSLTNSSNFQGMLKSDNRDDRVVTVHRFNKSTQFSSRVNTDRQKHKLVRFLFQN